MTESEDYGKKYEFDARWSGPLYIQRRRTDHKFLKSLGIFSIIWIVIAIYAYTSVGEALSHRYSQNSYTRVFKREATQSSESDYVKISINILTFIIASAILSITYVVSLRWTAKLLVYTVIAIFFILLFCITCFTAVLYNQNSDALFLSLFLVCTIIFIVLLTIVIFLRKKINIACAVVQEASKCVVFNPTTLVFPLGPCFVFKVMTAFAGSVGLCLNIISSTYSEVPHHIIVFHGFNVFAYLWVGTFINAFSQMVLSGTFGTWYWTLNKSHVPRNTLTRMTKITFNNHLGSLAFGSLILAICTFIRILLNFIKKRLEGRCNPFACCCLGCYQRLFGVLEKIVRYINRNAYIMCAVHGTSFYQSAKDAFNLLMRNIVKVVVIGKVTDLIIFLGQMITLICSLLGVFLFSQGNPELVLELVVVGVASILITTFISDVLKVAIDTIFLCVLEDYERNDGSEVRPYFMSLKLKTLLLNE